MMAYCENCSRKELMIQLLTDAWRLRNLSPAGIGMSGLDLLVRNSPLPNTVEGGFRDAREWIENYETIFGENGNDQGEIILVKLVFKIWAHCVDSTIPKDCRLERRRGRFLATNVNLGSN